MAKHSRKRTQPAERAQKRGWSARSREKDLALRTPRSHETQFQVDQAQLHPGTLSPQEIRRLQQTAGNRAVTRLLVHRSAAIVQRAPAKGDKYKDKGLAELDELLSQIGEKGQKVDIPPVEVISGTTAAEGSGGGIEGEIERLWRREKLTFTKAARKAARKQTGRRRSVSTQSPHIKPSKAYGKRWSLNLLAADYKGKKADLMDILRLTRKGSPFQKSQAAESNKVLDVKNPTAEEMRTQISEAIFGLHGKLDAGEIGELVVYFAGHGSSGTFSGINWEVVTKKQLASLANLARDFNIHMVYVLDTCRGGPLTHIGRMAAVGDIEKRGAQLPGKLQKAFDERYNLMAALGNLGYRISVTTLPLGDWVRHYWKRPSDKRFRPVIKALALVHKQVSKLGQHLAKDDPVLKKLPELPRLKKLQSRTSMALLRAFEGTRRLIKKATRNIAWLIDGLNDVVNRLIKGLYKASKGANK
ncbi:MAG: hypothetical protein WA996_20620 [Candidatus Promineifilaceae bacterium]